MGGTKYLRFFHSEASQVVDIEKAAIVYFIGGNPPIGKPVGLLFQQVVQQVKTLWFAGCTVEQDDIFLNKLMYLRKLPTESCQVTLADLFVAMANQNFFLGFFLLVRQIFKGADKVVQFQKAAVLVAQPTTQSLQVMTQNERIVPDPPEIGVVIGDRKGTAIGVETKGKLSALQYITIMVTKDRQQNPAGQIRLLRPPVNIEKSGKTRGLTIFQNIHPPLVV